MATCDPGQLVVNSECLECLSKKELLAIQTLLLCQIAGIAANAEQLEAASVNLQELSRKQLLSIQAYLLCQIASGLPSGPTLVSVSPNPISTFVEQTLTITGTGFSFGQNYTISITDGSTTDGPYTATYINASTLTIDFNPQHEMHGATNVSLFVNGSSVFTLNGGITFN